MFIVEIVCCNELHFMNFRPTFHKIFQTFLFVLIFCISAEANAQINLAQALKREKALIHATTNSDSIRILLDVYNLSDRVNRDRLRVQIMDLAQRSDNNEVLNDVLKELSTSTDDTRDLARLIEISENLPKDSARDNLQTVLIMEQANADAPSVGDSDVENQMVETLRQGMSMGGDPYKEIQNIYRAMVYLGASSQGPLYFEYVKRLDELVEALPEEDHAIRNLFYTTAAIYYTRKRDCAKAIEYDQKLINELDKIKARYTDKEKADRDLNYFYYVSYRRMLRNFRALTPEQIQEAYDKCVELAKINEEAGKEFGTGGLTNSYYYFATKQYAKAIPELKKALSSDQLSDYRRTELLGYISYAMRMTGDKEGELIALRDFSNMLLKDRKQKREDLYREIDLRNSVNKIINDEYQEQLIQRQENSVMRKTSITLVYVLALVLIFMCGAYFRLRQRVKELEIRNNRLHKNIEYIFDDGRPKGTHNVHTHKDRLKG